MSQTKFAQPVPVQPLALPANSISPPVPSPLQPSAAPMSSPAAPVAGAKPPTAKSVAMTSGAEMGAKSSSLRRAEVLSILYKYGMYARKRSSRVGIKTAGAPSFFQRRGTDTLRLARYLGERFNIDALKGMSAGKLVSPGAGRVNRERELLGQVGAGAVGAAGLGAAGLGYGTYKALGGGEDEA